MTSKILILAFVACYQVATAQIPTGLPNPLSTGMTPPFFGNLNNNWMRPWYTAAAEGWRTYFEQLNQARNQLLQTLNTFQPQNVDLKPPAVEVPGRPQVATPVPRPQSQSDAQVPRPQGPVGHASQGQAGGRQPAVAIPNVTSGTRPIASTVASSVVPQVPAQIVPQVPNWVGK